MEKQVSATFTLIGFDAMNITIENAVFAGSHPCEIDIFIKEGGLDALTQWNVAGTLDWPEERSYLLRDLKSGTLYGIDITKFEKHSGKVEGSLTEDVFIPVKSGYFVHIIEYFSISILLENTVVLRKS